MARPRTPSNVLEMRGAYKKDPQRKRENEPESNGEVGAPKPDWSEDVKACWFEIIELTAPGVLCKSDRLALEMAANLLAKLRKADWSLPAAVLARYESLIGKFGMNPSDRSKVSVPKTSAGNPFSKILKKAKPA